MSLLLPLAWSVELRGLSGPVLGTGGGDLDCLTADDGGITKFPLLLNSRDLEEIEVRIAFVYHYLIKFQNLIEYLQLWTMNISAKVYWEILHITNKMQRRRTYGHAVIMQYIHYFYWTTRSPTPYACKWFICVSTFSTDLNTIMCCYVHLLISLKVIHVQTLNLTYSVNNYKTNYSILAEISQKCSPTII